MFAPCREGWARAVLVIPRTGNPFTDAEMVFFTVSFLLLIFLWLRCGCMSSHTVRCLHVVLSRAFCPVRSPCPVLMPSRRLDSNPAPSSTPTTEVILVGEPHRSPLVRRKICICSCFDSNLCFPSLQLLHFYKEISLPYSLMAVKSRSALGEERRWITSTTEIPFD